MEKGKLTICFLGEAKKEDVFTMRWARYFSDRGYNIHLISYSLPEGEGRENIKAYLIKKKFPRINSWPFNTILNLPFSLAMVKKIVRSIEPDILHAQCVTSYGTLGSLLNFHPFIVTAYGSDILINPQKFLPTKWSTKHILDKADLITCDAEHMKKAMMKLGVSSFKIKIIYFGIDTEKFSPGPKDERIKKEYGILESDKVVISLRSLEPIYNIETLIEAMPLILKKNTGVKFIVAGKGSEEKKLKELVKELKVSRSVKFVGYISNEELPRYLRTSDVYVSTSLSDGGLASSSAEAMACGLPVILTDSGENRNWIEDEKDGFIIPVKSPKFLAEKIIHLLGNNEDRKKFGERSRKIIEERNDYYKEMAKMEEIYLNLAKKKANI